MNYSEIKYYEKLKQKKHRDEEGLFLVEGIHLVEECLKSEEYCKRFEQVFIRDGFKNEELLKRINAEAQGAKIDFLEEYKFDKLSETENSQGIIAAIVKKESDLTTNTLLTDLRSQVRVALDHISDPGNLGTIIRTCHWFGVSEILISENSADIYNSKVIRSTQGAIFHVNIRNEIDLEHELKNLVSDNFEIILTDLNTNHHLSDYAFDKNKNYLFVFGSEAHGISDVLLENTNYQRIKISNYSESESLNVAVTSGIILYELKKMFV